MWTQITIMDGKKYQDGKEVKEIILDGTICDIRVCCKHTIWLKIGNKNV